MAEAFGVAGRVYVTARVCGPQRELTPSSLEKDDMQTDPTTLSGKADTAG
jgi:hypothetical protein